MVQILAIDNYTKKRLVVECTHDMSEKRLQHIFKINFEKSIAYGECFDISFSIRLPKELTVLNKDKEITSISLVRIINKPIEELEFNVCLNFEPRAIKAFGRHIRNNTINEIPGATKSDYNPSSDIERYFDIEWTSKPTIIKFHTYSPKYDQYIIQYFK